MRTTMRNFGTICMLFCLSVLFNGCSNTSSKGKEVANQEQVALAESLLLNFQQEQFDKIVVHLDEKIKQQLNKEQLAVVWAQLNTQFGKYTKSEFYKAEKVNNVGDKVVYICYFGSNKLYFQLLLGKENRVIGLFFTPQSN